MAVKVRDNGIHSQDKVCANISIFSSHVTSGLWLYLAEDIIRSLMFFRSLCILPANLSRSCRAVRHQAAENSTTTATETRARPAEEPTNCHGWYGRMTDMCCDKKKQPCSNISTDKDTLTLTLYIMYVCPESVLCDDSTKYFQWTWEMCINPHLKIVLRKCTIKL